MFLDLFDISALKCIGGVKECETLCNTSQWSKYGLLNMCYMPFGNVGIKHSNLKQSNLYMKIRGPFTNMD